MDELPCLQSISEVDSGPAVAHGNRVLVWGALGMIGSHLTGALLAEGFDVSVLCRSRSAEPRWAAQVEWFELDSDSPERVLERAVASASIIFDLAGSSGAVSSNKNPIESLDQNCRIHLQFLQACQRAGHKPHVVFTSSRLVYGPTNQSRVSEEHPISPRSMYAAHKLCVEQYLQIYAGMGAITYSVCRISNAYGPDYRQSGRGYKILNSFIEKSLAGLPITLFGNGEQARDFIYIDDLAALLILCCVSPNAINQTFNIGSGNPCRLVDAAMLIREFTGAPPFLFQPWPEEYLAVESGDYVSDIGKARRLLEFCPKCDIQDGILRTLKSYKDGEVTPTETVGSATVPPLAVA